MPPGKPLGQAMDVPIVGSAAASQNFHAEFPVQVGNRSAEHLGILLYQAGVVVQFFRVEGSGVGQRPTIRSLTNREELTACRRAALKMEACVQLTM